MSHEKHHQTEGLEAVETALSKSEQFIEKNQKIITIVALALVVLVGGYFAFNKFYQAPRENEAMAQMYVAQQYFERDSFNLVLNGDGNYPGVLEIIDEYGMTKSANLARYYAGVSYLHMGNYEEAISNLESFDGDDTYLGAEALGCMGDAYVELKQLDKAADYYKKAADYSENNFTTPIYLMKLGMVYEETAKFNEAIATYEQIKKDYPRSPEGRQIDKYITRAQLGAGK